MSDTKVIYGGSGISIFEIWFYIMLFLFIFTERSCTQSMKWPMEAYDKIVQDDK